MIRWLAIPGGACGSHAVAGGPPDTTQDDRSANGRFPPTARRAAGQGTRAACSTLALLLGFFALASLALADDASVSFSREVLPVLKHNCQGCHRAGKAKGGLDVTTFGALLKGGKHGATFKPGAPDDSRLFSRADRRRRTGGCRRTTSRSLPAEVQLIQRWIAQGAKDDSPADQGADKVPEPPVLHRLLPSVTSLAWSPDGAQLLAVAGTGEVQVLHSGAGEKHRCPPGRHRAARRVAEFFGGWQNARGGRRRTFGFRRDSNLECRRPKARARHPHLARFGLWRFVFAGRHPALPSAARTSWSGPLRSIPAQR